MAVHASPHADDTVVGAPAPVEASPPTDVEIKAQQPLSPDDPEAKPDQEPAQDSKLDAETTAYVLPEHEEAEDTELDPELNRRLLRSLDLYVSLPVGVMFLFSFIDRSSLGNAYTDGLGKDLNFPPSGLNLATTLFFIPYVLFEPISTIVFRRVGAKYMLPGICMAWGLVTLFTGFCGSYHGFLAVRIMLGATESAFFPCAALYLTYFYRREELGLRTAVLFVASALSGAFSGLLAAAIFNMKGIGGKAGWAWFYILLGLATFLVGLIIFFILADSPETAWFIRDPKLRKIAAKRSRIINQFGASGSGHSISWPEVKEGLLDLKLWIGSISQFGADTMLFSVATFMVLIIKQIQPGRNNIVIQLLTVPVYAFGAIVYLATAVLTDRYGYRHATMIGMAVLTVVGYAILLGCKQGGVLYFATFLTVNCYTFVGINVSLQNSNQAGSSKRAVGSGLQLAIGNTGGIVAGQIYRSGRYNVGYAVSIGLTMFSVILYLINWAYMGCMNRARDQLETQLQQQDKDIPSASDLTALEHPPTSYGIGPGLRTVPGDRNLSFRYKL